MEWRMHINGFEVGHDTGMDTRESRTYRITSYNVCYTKLLRLVLVLQLSGCSMGWQAMQKHRISDDQLLPAVRITSYNVCYTKLLRTVRNKNQ